MDRLKTMYEMRENRVSYEDIGIKFGITKQRVEQIFKANGKLNVRAQKKPKILQISDDDIARLKNGTVYKKYLIQKYKTTNRLITRALKLYGIKYKRPRSKELTDKLNYILSLSDKGVRHKDIVDNIVTMYGATIGYAKFLIWRARHPEHTRKY